MVKAIVDITMESNTVLNVLKAKHGFVNKSETIDFVVKAFEEQLMEPDLKPSYIDKADKIMRGQYVKVGSLKEMRKRYE